MKIKDFCSLAIVLVVAIFSISYANAADLYLNSPLETDYYQSDGDIFAQDGCVVPQAKNVRFLAQSSIALEPGFRVESGSTFVATIGNFSNIPPDADIDGDGLPDQLELTYFGDLIQGPGDDYDNDGMLDGWEINNGLDPTVDDTNTDADGDGFSNCIEYITVTNPSDSGSKPRKGIYYEYDSNGRIKKLIRVQ